MYHTAFTVETSIIYHTYIDKTKLFSGPFIFYQILHTMRAKTLCCIVNHFFLRDRLHELLRINGKEVSSLGIPDNENA